MTETDDRNGDGGRDEIVAGEYVLGVLSLEERRAVEARIAAEPAFAARVQRWESDLATFNSAYEEVRPPAALLSRIEGHLFPAAAPVPAGRTSLWNSLALWRGLTVVALLAVAGLAAVLAGVGRPQPAGAPLIAHLTAKNSSISLVALYDEGTGLLKLTPVAAQADEPKSLELWMINGKQPPVSLGLVPQNGRGAVVVPENMRDSVSAGTVLAISLEPQGGSPTGAPTGPVLAAGPARSL